MKNQSLNQTIFILVISVAAVLAYSYYYKVSKPFLSDRLILHQQIINGTASSPYRFRILIPFVAEISTQILSRVLPPKHALALAYVGLDFISISFLLLTLYTYLINWFEVKISLIGVLFCAGVINLTFHDHFFQPWTFWEGAFTTLWLQFTYRKNYNWLFLIIIISSLNRETAVFLSLLFLFTTQDFQKIFRKNYRFDFNLIGYFLTYLMLWAIIFFGIRVFQGNTTHVEKVEDILHFNLQFGNLWKAGVNIILYLGGFWVFVFKGYKNAPFFVQRSSWILPFYFVILAIWSYWLEIRLWIPLYSIFIPMGLSSISEKLDSKKLNW